MTFIRFLFSRFKKPYFYFVLIFNFFIAWPIYASIIALKNLEIYQNNKLFGELIHFYLQGFGPNRMLMLSVSLGTMLLFTFFYIWLRFKKNIVWEKHYLRSVIIGSFLGFLNLFPTFFLYHFYLGEREISTLLFFALIGPFIALAIVGPISLLSGAILGLFNGILAHLIISKEKRKLFNESNSAE